MRTRLGRALLAWVPIAGLVLAVLVGTPSTSQAGVVVGGKLEVSPKSFVNGQALTFAGRLPHPGRQRVRLQFNMNRTGDDWTTVEGFSAMTDAKGAFRFKHPAPAMFNISYRVIGGRYATKGVKLAAQSQQISMSFSPGSEAVPDSVVADEPFTVVVDSAASMYTRPDGNPPTLPGRTVALQRRAGSGWTTVQSAKADERGLARFQLSAGAPGTLVYRVRLDDYRVGGSRIGWFPGFPTYVRVLERPDPVTGATVTDVSDTTADLSWTPPADPVATGFTVAWKKGSVAPTSPEDADGSEERIKRPTSSYRVTGLDPDTVYSFSVFSRSDELLLSAPSTATARTEEPAPPSDVTSLQVRDVGTTSANLDWQLPGDMSFDSIVVSRTAGSVAPATPAQADRSESIGRRRTSYGDGGLAPGTTYTYTVFTYDSRYDLYSTGSSVTVTTEAQ